MLLQRRRAHPDNLDVGAEVSVESAIALHGAHDVLRLPQRVLQPLQALLARRPVGFWGTRPPRQLLLQVICLVPARAA